MNPIHMCGREDFVDRLGVGVDRGAHLVLADLVTIFRHIFMFLL
jgi:hypothetical protein